MKGATTADKEDSSAAATTDLLVNLDGTPFAAGDVIEIDGVDADGVALGAPAMLNVLVTTDVQDLLNAITAALSGGTGVTSTLTGAGIITVTTNTNVNVTPDLALDISIQLGDPAPIGAFVRTQDGSDGVNENLIDSTAGENVVFTSPTVSLTINGRRSWVQRSRVKVRQIRPRP